MPAVFLHCWTEMGMLVLTWTVCKAESCVHSGRNPESYPIQTRGDTRCSSKLRKVQRATVWRPGVTVGENYNLPRVILMASLSVVSWLIYHAADWTSIGSNLIKLAACTSSLALPSPFVLTRLGLCFPQ